MSNAAHADEVNTPTNRAVWAAAEVASMKATPAKRVRAPRAVAAPAPAVVAPFSVSAWRLALTEAAIVEGSSAKQLLNLALAARGLVEVDTAREAFQDAYAAAYVKASPEVTDEQARILPTVRNRVSEAMAVFKAAVLPDPMPNNLSRAADACRKLNAKPKPEILDQEDGGDGQEDGEGLGQGVGSKAKPEDEALTVVFLALESLQRQAVNNKPALEALSAMLDLAQALSEALNEA